MNDQVAKLIKRIFNVVSIVGLVATVIGALYLWRIGAFTDQSVLKDLILAHHYLGPIIFLAIQVIQVVIPIIPGGITLAAGVLIFGPLWGFIYNYIGIVVGSIILFHIGRTYGTSLAKTLVKEKTYNRYMDMAEKHQRKFNIIFFLLILSPVAPDDALVLIASQTKMTWRFLLFTTVIAKAPAILAYSYILIYGGEWLAKFFH
ncbi:MAG: TVP38/TMEM64 family protein [Streptococcaceae bacterium]|jgi:uncharacterized membrane protein YdjX (TVP38/TMEM64 family)|nr:TVP38/TMEM64 family protein [Streptococcaceae bacterium]